MLRDSNYVTAKVELSIGEKYAQPAVLDFWSQFARQGLLAAEVAMLARYAPAQPARLLDVGCGAGWVSMALGPAGYQVTGLDITAAMLDAAQTLAGRAGQPAAFVQGDMLALPLAEDAFDVAVIFIAGLQHILGRKRRQQAFREISRTLRPAGVLIVALDKVAPALRCYWEWNRAGLVGDASAPAGLSMTERPADALLAQGRLRTSRLGWHARGLARSLRWRTWEGLRDVGRSLGWVAGEPGDTAIQQVSMPPTPGRVPYHLYRHEELLDDAALADFRLLGYHSALELAENKPVSEAARRLDKQVLYAWRYSGLA